MYESFDFYINKLPCEIGREIFRFIIPDKNQILFKSHRMRENGSYSKKHTFAFFNNKLLKNEEGSYLTRIEKKNGKHRYYIIKEYIDDVLEIEYNDRAINIYHYGYNSTYIGKNLDLALLFLLS